MTIKGFHIYAGRHCFFNDDYIGTYTRETFTIALLPDFRQLREQLTGYFRYTLGVNPRWAEDAAPPDPAREPEAAPAEAPASDPAPTMAEQIAKSKAIAAEYARNYRAAKKLSQQATP